jgi:aspartate aminotransferase
MDFVTPHISTLAPSITLAVTSQAAKMKKEGIDVCSFGAGEPDMDTPAHIKEACVRALAEGKTKYTASAGLLELREAICVKLAADNQLEYTPDLLSVNCGAKHSCFNAILATCGPGDEVVIPSPYWTSYPDMVRIAGAIPVMVQTKQENGWKMTPEEFFKKLESTPGKKKDMEDILGASEIDFEEDEDEDTDEDSDEGNR